jgi:hypothetical protein
MKSNSMACILLELQERWFRLDLAFGGTGVLANFLVVFLTHRR